MSRADFYFMTNLHLMYDKSTLDIKNGIDAAALPPSMNQRVLINKHEIKPEDNDSKRQEDERYGVLIDLLEKLFQNFSMMTGGGITLERLKDIIRGKVKNIKIN
jgi:hypothetical protein